MAGFQIPMDIVIKVQPPEAFEYVHIGYKDTFVAKLIVHLSKYS